MSLFLMLPFAFFALLSFSVLALLLALSLLCLPEKMSFKCYEFTSINKKIRFFSFLFSNSSFVFSTIFLRFKLQVCLGIYEFLVDTRHERIRHVPIDYFLQMRCFSRFGTICTIQKCEKHLLRSVKSNIPLLVFFTFFKLYR